MNLPANALSIVSRNPIFQGMTTEETADLLRDRVAVCRYEKGEEIYSAFSYQKSLGFVISGKAQVLRKGDEGSDVLLNELNPPGSFGAAAVFSSTDSYPTVVRAKSRCVICFLDEEKLEEIFRENFQVTRNYLAFLTDRVNFLTGKIECFTLGTVEERLSFYLQENVTIQGGRRVVQIPSSTQLASMLGISRASLYRVLEQLEERGALKKEGKAIWLLADPIVFGSPWKKAPCLSVGETEEGERKEKP